MFNCPKDPSVCNCSQHNKEHKENSRKFKKDQEKNLRNTATDINLVAYDPERD